MPLHCPGLRCGGLRCGLLRLGRGIGQFAAVRGSILWPFLREPYWCAILALTLNTAAYGSEIIPAVRA